MFDGLQQVVMIAPVDADEDKAKRVAEKYGSDRDQRLPGSLVRNFEFQHHDRDDDRDHSVAECFQPALTHFSVISSFRLDHSRMGNDNGELKNEECTWLVLSVRTPIPYAA